jgi:tRNA C32,U32 (ribose-2'-O)-methylase TrmJ
MAESEGVLAAVLATLTERKLLRPAKAEAQADYLRILWQRLRPNRRELEFLAGLLRKMAGSGPDAP